jgi:selenocysteine lyase/cysteine desulfurase
MQQRNQIEIVVIPNDASGCIALDSLEAAIDKNTRLIAITHVPSQQGVVQPAAAVGAIARRHGLLFLLDASQSVGQLPVDVQVIGCHLLTASGRKFLRGPRGTGFLYVNRDVVAKLEPAFVDLHAAQWTSADSYALHPDARRFENFECYVAGKIALGVAVEYALDLGLEQIQQRIAGLSRYLRGSLESLPGITVHDPSGHDSGILTFSSATEEAQALHNRLRQAGINSGLAKRANALLDFSRRGLGNINRLSVHYYNTTEEIDQLIKVVNNS